MYSKNNKYKYVNSQNQSSKLDLLLNKARLLNNKSAIEPNKQPVKPLYHPSTSKVNHYSYQPKHVQKKTLIHKSSFKIVRAPSSFGDFHTTSNTYKTDYRFKQNFFRLKAKYRRQLSLKTRLTRFSLRRTRPLKIKSKYKIVKLKEKKSLNPFKLDRRQYEAKFTNLNTNNQTNTSQFKLDKRVIKTLVAK